MGSAESIVSEIEQVGKDIENGFNRAVGEVQEVGREIQSASDRLIGKPDDPDSLISFLEDLTGQSLVKKLVDEPDRVPMAIPEARRSDIVIPSGSVEPVPKSNPDPQIPDNPIPDNPIPDYPVPDNPGGGRHLIPNNSNESDESHLEDIVSGESDTRAGMRLGNNNARQLWEPPKWLFNPKGGDYYVDEHTGHIVHGESYSPGLWEEAKQIGVAMAVYGLSYYLLSTYGGVVYQALRPLSRAPDNWVYLARNNAWRFGAGIRDVNGDALISYANLVDLRIQTTNLGYYFRLPQFVHWLSSDVWLAINRWFALPGQRVGLIRPWPQTLDIVQRMVNIGDVAIKSIVSALSAGIAFNLYDVKLAIDNFSQYSYPGKDPIIPSSLHIGANVTNNILDSTALKILAVIPKIFGVRDDDTSIKIVNCLWSFGKDLRPGNGRGNIDQAIDNLFNIYIPQALDGKHILDLIPRDVKDQAIIIFGDEKNILTDETIIIDILKKLANSGKLVEILDDIFTTLGTSESIKGVDVFWKIFKDRNLDSVLREAVIGFKSSPPPSPVNLMASTGNLNILGFQLYYSNVGDNGQLESSKPMSPSDDADNSLTSLLENLIGDKAISTEPVQQKNVGGRQLVSNNSNESSESHLENGVSGDSVNKGRKLWEPPTWLFNPKAGDYYVDEHTGNGQHGESFSPGMWEEAKQLAFTGVVYGLSYYLLSAYGGIVYQALRPLDASPNNWVYLARNNAWRYGAGVRDIFGEAMVPYAEDLDLRIETTNLGYYFRLPRLSQILRQAVTQRVYSAFRLPTMLPFLNVPMEQQLRTIQAMVDVGDAGIKAILSALSAGIGYNLYDAKIAVDNFSNFSFPGKDPTIRSSLHIGANITNYVMDSGALKILAVIPTVFGVSDEETSIKIVNCLWSFAKDLRPGNGKNNINEAIDNLFNTYIPQALDGKHILDLIPQDAKDQAIIFFGNEKNILTDETIIIGVLKKLANSGNFVELVDEIFTDLGATADTLDGVDVFWKIFKDQNLSSLLKEAVIGFKTSQPESPINLISSAGQLNILGFQLYHSNIQTDINTDVGKGADETDSKLLNFEVHGKYCGPGNPIDNGEPIDAFDRACQRHDIGYMKKGMFDAETDKEFVKELETILKDETLDKITRLKVKAAKLHFERVTVIQHGQKHKHS